MIEQLRQFERESGLDVYGLGAKRDKWEHTIEKFAELIVRECIGVVNKTDPPGYNDYPDYRDQIEQAFRSECATEIKKHFGVE